MNLPSLITRLTTPWGFLILGMLGIAWIRWELTAPNLWIGDDTGTYLTTMHFALGTDFTGVGGDRPPLIGFLMVPFVYGFGLTTGVKLLAVIASVIGALPFFLVARRVISPDISAVGALIFISLSVYADTLAFGFLTLLVLALVLLGSWAFLRFSDKPSFDRAVTASAIIALIPNLNQTAIIPYLGLLGLFTLFLGTKNIRKYWSGLLVLGVTAVLLSLGSLPYSQKTADVFLKDSAVEVIFRDPVSLVMAVLAIPLFVWTGKRIGGTTGAFIACGGASAMFLQALVAPSSMGLSTVFGRSINWLWMWGLMSVLWWVSLVPLSSWVGKHKEYAHCGIAVLVLVFLTVNWVWRFDASMEQYSTLTPQQVEAIEWLEANTGVDEIVAVHPYWHGYKVGGLANRRVISTVPVSDSTAPNCVGNFISTCSLSPDAEPDWQSMFTGYYREQDTAVRCLLSGGTNCNSGAKYLFTDSEVRGEALIKVYDGKVSVYEVIDD